MLSCFQFNLYAGVRAGGGIGDELEAPADQDFYLRFAFDITFFFFIIVIMLAIIQVSWKLDIQKLPQFRNKLEIGLLSLILIPAGKIDCSLL